MLKFAQDRQVIANTKVINRMTKMQLISEIRMIRDILSSGSKKIPIPTLIRTNKGDKSQKELTQNLCGADITRFDQKGVKMTNPRLNKDTNDEDDGYNAVSSKVEIITIHAKIEANSTNFHAPTVIKNFITEMRKGDTMLQIIQAEQETYNASKILDGNASIPDDREKNGYMDYKFENSKNEVTFHNENNNNRPKHNKVGDLHMV